MKSLKFILVVQILLVVGCTSLLKNKGIKFYEMGQYKKALIYLNIAAKTGPGDCSEILFV